MIMILHNMRMQEEKNKENNQLQKEMFNRQKEIFDSLRTKEILDNTIGRVLGDTTKMDFQQGGMVPGMIPPRNASTKLTSSRHDDARRWYG